MAPKKRETIRKVEAIKVKICEITKTDDIKLRFGGPFLKDSESQFFEIVLDQAKVLTMISRLESNLEAWLHNVFPIQHEDNELVVGIQLFKSNADHSTSLIGLSVGSACPVYLLPIDDSIPHCIHNFLGNMKVRFVGVKMIELQEKLIKDLKLHLANWSELAPFIRRTLGDLRLYSPNSRRGIALENMTIREMAKVALLEDHKSIPANPGSSWQKKLHFSMADIKDATVDTYLISVLESKARSTTNRRRNP